LGWLFHSRCFQAESSFGCTDTNIIKLFSLQLTNWPNKLKDLPPDSSFQSSLMFAIKATTYHCGAPFR
jgi:hypothetical protein